MTSHTPLDTIAARDIQQISQRLSETRIRLFIQTSPWNTLYTTYCNSNERRCVLNLAQDYHTSMTNAKLALDNLDVDGASKLVAKATELYKQTHRAMDLLIASDAFRNLAFGWGEKKPVLLALEISLRVFLE
jgi:hypothetical protein